MTKDVIIPAQVRAGRALMGWSQEQLATEAGVGLSSIRDVESQKRASEAGVVSSIRRALENAGVVFVPGSSHEGPGVRLIANRPNIIRRPTKMTMWEGLPFTVEWRGKEITVFVAMEALEDLGRLTGKQPDSAFFETFEKYRGSILDGVVRAAADPANFDRHDCLHVRGKDIPELGL